MIILYPRKSSYNFGWTGGFTSSGMAEDGERALELCERLKPDVVLMDLEMPNLDGIHATKMIKKMAGHSCTHSVNLPEYRKGQRNHTKWCGWICTEIHRFA